MLSEWQRCWCRGYGREAAIWTHVTAFGDKKIVWKYVGRWWTMFPCVRFVARWWEEVARSTSPGPSVYIAFPLPPPDPPVHCSGARTVLDGNVAHSDPRDPHPHESGPVLVPCRTEDLALSAAHPATASTGCHLSLHQQYQYLHITA